MEHNLVIANMYERRSVRRYLQKEVAADDLQEILHAAVQAACGGNTQQWKFVVLESEDAKTKLNAAVRFGMLDLVLGEKPYKSMVSGKKAAEKEDYCCYFHAPVWILIAGQRDYPNAMADSALAVSNIMHAAQSLGLGTCWVNQVPWTCDDARVAAVLKEFGIESDHRVCASLSLGYAAMDGKKPERKEPDVQIF